MRDCRRLISLLNKKYPDMIRFIKEVAYRKENDIFVGIRENEITLYYKNAKIVTIRHDKTLCIKTHKKYVGVDAPKDYVQIEFEYLKTHFEEILNNIIMTKPKEERILQQWIVNCNNNDINSDWYFLDMEYNTKGVYAGRFDMIAISKSTINGKHQVALIELKVGTKSIRSDKFEIRKRGKDKTKDELEKELKDKTKDVLNNPSSLYKADNKEINYGSGMVGHIADYLRYLERDYYNYMLRKEICSIIRCHLELGVLPTHFLELQDIEYGDLSMKPEVRFICYNYFDDEKKTELSEIKDAVYGALFVHSEKESGAELCLQEVICIDDILEFIDNKELFKGKENNFTIKKEIRGVQYDFIFSFIDKGKENSWNCMYELR